MTPVSLTECFPPIPGQYYDAELDDGLDMFKKRNQKRELSEISYRGKENTENKKRISTQMNIK
jgi:hypothetical protein